MTPFDPLQSLSHPLKAWAGNRAAVAGLVMTETEIYRLLAQPVIIALAILSFSKVPWPRRALVAVASAVAGAAVGAVGVWGVRVGAPGWTPWAVLAALLTAAGLMWLRRRRVST